MLLGGPEALLEALEAALLEDLPIAHDLMEVLSKLSRDESAESTGTVRTPTVLPGTVLCMGIPAGNLQNEVGACAGRQDSPTLGSSARGWQYGHRHTAQQPAA